MGYWGGVGMSRILGIDVGDKRVGIALSDPSGSFATPHTTLLRAGGAAEDGILQLVQEHGVEVVVVGLPLGAGGERNPQCDKVGRFCRRLSKRAAVRIVFVDEHLSSEDAQEKLRASGRSHFKKEEVDAVAAALILQAHLDTKERPQS